MHKAPETVHIKTFGCQMNVHDSDRMLDLLRLEGFREEANLAQADVILVNTCSIREKSENRVLSLFGQLKHLKDGRPDRILGITGCVGSRMGRVLLQKIPHLDLVLGPDTIDRVGELVKEVRTTGNRLVAADLDTSGRTYSQPTVVSKARPAEFLTIIKGCDHFCTYCIVPFTRGREKSRPIAEIVLDVQGLARRGTSEVTFLGQNINTYGKGTPERLSQLIEATSRIEGIERIRYLTSHPRDLGEDLIEQFRTVEKLCPALHLPFQSGSNAVLKRMARLYTREQYLAKIDGLKKARPDIALSADVIVGFPGETDADFEDTLRVLREVRFSHAFLFKYSPRPGTRATQFGEEITESVKEERLKQAQEIAFGWIEKETRAYVGTRQRVLVEAVAKRGAGYTGRNPWNKLVHIEGAQPEHVGKMVDVDILDCNLANLKGRLAP